MFGPISKKHLKQMSDHIDFRAAATTEGSFLENYSAHIIAKLTDMTCCLLNKQKYDKALQNILEDEPKKIDFKYVQLTLIKLAPIMSELCFELSQKQASFMERLYDRYDYCDTVIQATIIPATKVILAAVLSIASAIALVHELYQQCMILCGLRKNSSPDKGLVFSKTASQLAMASLSLYFTALTDFISGAIGMVTRPVSTAILGCKEPEINISERASRYRFVSFAPDNKKLEPENLPTPLSLNN